ncbi:hypothetical protein PoB_006797400 [Plakobranchus ocellatus]|uniref:Uncharacterized protein n=1 Tax=Plakobranchus ocellatus TaxID=259542 RepID=A0AAV4DB70_9GAST|nr:hypothetical protein PoB_006797400 [Plakobranchus ocellatus]
MYSTGGTDIATRILNRIYSTGETYIITKILNRIYSTGETYTFTKILNRIYITVYSNKVISDARALRLAMTAGARISYKDVPADFRTGWLSPELPTPEQKYEESG